MVTQLSSTCWGSHQAGVLDVHDGRRHEFVIRIQGCYEAGPCVAGVRADGDPSDRVLAHEPA